jgi:c-di-GMP-binding flagellar brake protein YcgR
MQMVWLYNIIKPLSDKIILGRRKYLRVNSAVKINYQIGNDTPRVNCVSRDISEGGVRLSLYQHIKIGTTLKLGIYLQDTAEPEQVFGKLVWEKETPGKDYPFEAGIEFSLFDPVFRSRIHSYVESTASGIMAR